MHFEQLIDGCLSTAGDAENRLRFEEVEVKLQALDSIVRELSDRRETMPHLTLPARSDDLAEIREAAAFLADGADDVLILGTGGSSLGAQALAQLAGWQVPGCRLGQRPRLHFFDNLDPVCFDRALEELDLARTKVFSVSKSGGTAETLMQTLALVQAYDAAGLREKIGMHFLGLSEPRRQGASNALRDVLEPHGVRFLEHDPELGGRYAVLSNVGLVPAAVAGVDIAAVREGARFVLDSALDSRSCHTATPCVGAALNAAFMRALPNINIAVLWAYSDRLRRFTAWWVQLWAESLGKDGKGTTPLAAVGPVDQHSQQQLYLGGPRDKLVTFIETRATGQGARITPELARELGAGAYAGKSLGDLTACLQRATAETLMNNGLPVRRLQVETLDAKSLGALLMHFMLETILTGRLMGVDPFDQPAVEEGKVLARQYLAEL